jgi:hypothetical protein
MLIVRNDLIVSARDMHSPSKRIREMSAVIGKTDPRDYTMYFATPEFSDMFYEMRHTFTADLAEAVMEDVARAAGDFGMFVIGFQSGSWPVLNLPLHPEDLKRPEVQNSLREDRSVHMDEHGGHGLTDSLMVLWSRQADGDYTLYAYMMTANGYTWSAFDPSPLAYDALVIAWMLLNPPDKIVEQREQPLLAGMPPAAKAKMTKAAREAKVTIVSLRRLVRKQLGEVRDAERTLQHRFIVRGHWRQQAVGPGRKDHRPVYIAPFVKGPEGAPFLDREKVYKW